MLWLCLFVSCSFFLETVPKLYDNNTYTCVYIVVSILDCNYSPREPKGRG